MSRCLNARDPDVGDQNWGHYVFRARTLGSIRRQRLAISEATRWLSEALAASPYAVYIRGALAFEPALVHGIEYAASFPVGGSLPRALRRACRPVMTTRSHRARLLQAALDPRDRASLRRAGAIALAPLALDGDLDAFLLVGGSLAAFDPGRLARALAPVSACLRIARDGAPRPGPEHGPGWEGRVCQQAPEDDRSTHRASS